MSLLDPIKPYWYIIRTVLFGVAVLVAVLYVRGCGKAAGEAEVAKLKASHAQVMAEIATKSAEASEKARAAETAVAKAFAKIHDQNAKDVSNANQERDRLRACLRDGTCGLRREWQCPSAHASGLPEDPQGGDDAADLRAQGASDLVGNAELADAEIRAWQARWEAWRVEYEQYRESLK